MRPDALPSCLLEHYGLRAELVEPFRDSGNATFIVYAEGVKYFLRVTKPAFRDTALTAIEVHAHLQERGFPVPKLYLTTGGQRCLPIESPEGESLLALYEFLEGAPLETGQEPEAVGALLGRLHVAMEDFPGKLVTRDRDYFIDRFDRMIRAKESPQANAFAALGESLWKSVRDLPRGYAHGDAYCGNFHRTPDGRLYLLDLDTSCRGLPAYDLALAGNASDYFQLAPDHALRTREAFGRMLPAYRAHHPLAEAEERALHRLIALSHFALQATIVDIFGLGCVDDQFFDDQLLWHRQWREQCEALGLWS